MDVINIVRMANQITAFFAAYPKQEALAASRSTFMRLGSRACVTR